MNKGLNGKLNAIVVGLGVLAIAGCGGGGGGGGIQAGNSVFGITPAGSLVRFEKNNPAIVTTVGAVDGLDGGESLVAIDFRPFTNQLYALSSQSRLYTINTSNADATPVGAAFTPALVGSVFGMDFNPAADRLRIVSDAEQNIRINADTGALLTADTNLAFVAGDPNAGNTPDVAALAYTNNTNPPPASATAYVVDTTRDVLARLGGVDGTPSPNGGGLTTIGPLGVDATSGLASLDISGNGTALAVMTVGGTRGLYTVNLTTGAATLVGALGANVSEIAITL